MRGIAGNIKGYYPMVKIFINDLKTGNQGPVATIGLPLFQKAQNKHLKRTSRIKQKYADGVYNRNDLRIEFKVAQCQLMCDFTEAMVIAVNRFEKFKQGPVSV